VEYRVIKSPSESVLKILEKRIRARIEDLTTVDAIGLVQGRMIDMVVAADVAEKSNNVFVSDVNGACPQNMIMMAILGDTASVEASMDAIKKNLEKEVSHDYS